MDNYDLEKFDWFKIWLELAKIPYKEIKLDDLLKIE